MRKLLILVLPLVVAGCQLVEDKDDAALNAASGWAEAYFNCDYQEAGKYATEESGKWLRFAASNTTDDDLQVLQQAGGVQVTADEYFTVANDTLRQVTLHVSNFLATGTLGQPARIADRGTFVVTLVNRNGKWKVRMEGLPRSERQSRD
ncbi:MAG: hypothetical protein IJ200_01335 [Prevotella sp.]|nr:hypothetical protein [Prevotella sp.]